MLNDTDLARGEIWESLTVSRENREAFVSAHLSSNIGAQIFALRESRGWSQGQLAAEVGMAQPRISVLEGGYDNYSLRTVRRFASAFDVAVVVRFVPFSELVNWVTSLTTAQLAPVDFANDSPIRQHIGTGDTLLATNAAAISNALGGLSEPGMTLIASHGYSDYEALASVTGHPYQAARPTWQAANITGTTQERSIYVWDVIGQGGLSTVPLGTYPHASGVPNVVGDDAGADLNSQLNGYFPIPTQMQTQMVVISQEMTHV